MGDRGYRIYGVATGLRRPSFCTLGHTIQTALTCHDAEADEHDKHCRPASKTEPEKQAWLEHRCIYLLQPHLKHFLKTHTKTTHYRGNACRCDTCTTTKHEKHKPQLQPFKREEIHTFGCGVILRYGLPLGNSFALNPFGNNFFASSSLTVGRTTQSLPLVQSTGVATL